MPTHTLPHERLSSLGRNTQVLCDTGAVFRARLDSHQTHNGT